MRPTLLIVGCRPNSLGEAILFAAAPHFRTVTAGIEGEDHKLDVTFPGECARIVDVVRPRHIVCTAGVNIPADLGSTEYVSALVESWQVNMMGPMMLLHAWEQSFGVTMGEHLHGGPHHYVAISSNSAHIARRESGPYCASKAALTMAIRCAARELAETPLLPYVYEPGLLAGTPMSAETRLRFGSVALHRMPGVGAHGLTASAVAEHVVHNLLVGGQELNGTVIRLDGGEQ